MTDGGNGQFNTSTTSTRVNVSLEFAYERVIGLDFPFMLSIFLWIQMSIVVKLIQLQVTKGMRVKVSGSLCDRRAALTMELLERLLETQGFESLKNFDQQLFHPANHKKLFHPANHSNFFSRFSHPLLSSKVTEWREQSTVRKKIQIKMSHY